MVKSIVKLTVGGVTRTVRLSTSGGPPLQQIVNVSLPTIAGSPMVGQVVTANNGTWSVTPDNFAYVWRRNGVAIPDANAQSYVCQAADEGTNTLSVTVFAFKANHQPGTATSAPVSVAEAPDPSPSLPFLYPAEAASSPKLVFAHYFPPNGPPSFSNSTTTSHWETGYLAINGESGAHAAYGGFTRDRPIITGNPWSTNPSFWVNMMRTEVEAARKFFLDGFLCDILGSSGQNWTIATALFEAASTTVSGVRVYPNFYVIPMLDADGSTAGAGATTSANALNTLLNYACAYRKTDGTYVVASYRAESQTPQFWLDVKDRLQTVHGKTVEFWHVFLNTNNAPNYRNNAAKMAVTGAWGTGSDPLAVQQISTSWVTQARAAGEKIVYPLWAGSTRPSTSHGPWFDETLNTLGLRTGWTRVIDSINPEYIQHVTWNDYTEGGQVGISRKHGEAVLALSAYYLARWKTGVYPTILRDAMWVVHRPQIRTHATAQGGSPPTTGTRTTITGGQTIWMYQNLTRVAESPMTYEVEVLTFLTAADTVTVTVGGTTYPPYNAPAGVHSQRFPAEFGSVSAVTGRGVQVISPYTIRSTSANQDLDYCWAYSLDAVPAQGTPEAAGLPAWSTRGNPTPA